LFITYRVVAGDTFSAIARKVYGSELQATRIANANPGVIQPLVAGTTVAIPPIPGSPSNRPQSGIADNVNECALLIDNERFRFWESVTIHRAIDSISTMEFVAPFDPTQTEQREIFRPFSYKTAEFTVGGNRLFTGTLMGIIPELTPDSKTLALGGYSTPGVLNDCMMPASAYPLNELNDLTLADIAERIAGVFGIEVVFEAAPGAKFDRVALPQNKKLLSFLADLAKQRGLVLTDDERGRLVFKKSIDTGVPVARLFEGAPPLISVDTFHDPQQYYSHITGIEPVAVGTSGSQFTVKNARLAGVLRPYTFTVKDAIGGDMQPATEAQTGRMFGTMASYSAAVSTWRDEDGELWSPNTVVQLLAPGAMVYTEYNFIVRSVTFERTANSESAVLDLVMPGSFSGQVPESLPWDD